MNHEKIYTERIEIKVSKGQRDIIEKLAKRNHLTMNEVIRQGIMGLFESEGRYVGKSKT